MGYLITSRWLLESTNYLFINPLRFLAVPFDAAQGTVSVFYLAKKLTVAERIRSISGLVTTNAQAR